MSELNPINKEELRNIFMIWQMSTDTHNGGNFPCIPQWNFEDLIDHICENFGRTDKSDKLAEALYYIVQHIEDEDYLGVLIKARQALEEYRKG